MLKQNNMSMTMSVLRSWFFPGLVQLALGSVLLAAEQAPEPWAAKPLGPKIAPAPFVPALIKRELRATLKVHPAKGAEMMLVDAGRSACAIMPMGMWKRSKCRRILPSQARRQRRSCGCATSVSNSGCKRSD